MINQKVALGILQMHLGCIKITRRTFLQATSAGLAGIVAGCGHARLKQERHTGTGQIHVVCTTALVADLVREIAGEGRGRVVSLMGEGVDPHLYKGSPRDVRDLAGADLIFASGLHLEGKLTSVLHRLAHQKHVHMIADEWTTATEKNGEADPWIRDDGVPDPHCWFDARLWQRLAQVVKDRLTEFAPDHAAAFTSNFKTYEAKVESLDAEIRRNLAKIPPSRRLLVTSHDAFRYFGRAYGVQVEGIQGLSTESEAGVRRTNELVDLLVSRQVPAIFVETSVSDDNVKALVEGAAARGHKVVIGGSLFSDAPGAFGTPEGTWLGMLQHNVNTFVKAMTGSNNAKAGHRTDSST